MFNNSDVLISFFFSFENIKSIIHCNAKFDFNNGSKWDMYGMGSYPYEFTGACCYPRFWFRLNFCLQDSKYHEANWSGKIVCLNGMF